MTLTAEQIKERKRGIGASEAARIASGDWHQLWLEKTSRADPKDLSGVFAVQLGHATEQLNCDWFERTESVFVKRRGENVICPDYSFIRCTLDGFTTYQGKLTVIQAKHVNPFSKMNDVVSRYLAQVGHEMICTGAPQAVLSVIIGTNEPVKELIPFDEFWAAEYIARCAEFWGYVERDEEPTLGKPVEIAPQMPLDQMRTMDMSQSNAWASFAADWLANEDASRAFEAAKKELKKLIPDDVRQATGHGIIATRKPNGIYIARKL